MRNLLFFFAVLSFLACSDDDGTITYVRKPVLEMKINRVEITRAPALFKSWACDDEFLGYDKDNTPYDYYLTLGPEITYTPIPAYASSMQFYYDGYNEEVLSDQTSFPLVWDNLELPIAGDRLGISIRNMLSVGVLEKTSTCFLDATGTPENALINYGRVETKGAFTVTPDITSIKDTITIDHWIKGSMIVEYILEE